MAAAPCCSARRWRCSRRSISRRASAASLLFWAAFILTRPLGATVGDFLDKPVAKGGLELSRPLATGGTGGRDHRADPGPAAAAGRASAARPKPRLSGRGWRAALALGAALRASPALRGTAVPDRRSRTDRAWALGDLQLRDRRRPPQRPRRRDRPRPQLRRSRGRSADRHHPVRVRGCDRPRLAQRNRRCRARRQISLPQRRGAGNPGGGLSAGNPANRGIATSAGTTSSSCFRCGRRRTSRMARRCSAAAVTRSIPGPVTATSGRPGWR